MNGRPSLDQLNQAADEFARQDTTAANESAYAYHAKVAANLREIVQREWAIGPEAKAAERTRLQRLVAEMPARSPPTGTIADPRREDPVHSRTAPEDLPGLQRQLCEAIARGAIDLASPGLAEHLWLTALDQVAIDQPTYATYRRHRPAPDGKTTPTRT